jgi:hypothetical protein
VSSLKGQYSLYNKKEDTVLDVAFATETKAFYGYLLVAAGVYYVGRTTH